MAKKPKTAQSTTTSTTKLPRVTGAKTIDPRKFSDATLVEATVAGGTYANQRENGDELFTAAALVGGEVITSKAATLIGAVNRLVNLVDAQISAGRV